MFNFPGATLLLLKLRWDLRHDPDTIERMIGNLPTRKAVDEELSTVGKVSTKGKWLLGATKVLSCGHSRVQSSSYLL